MKCSVLEKIKLKTSKGEIELLPGQVAALNNNIAARLINEGRIIPIEEIAEEAHPGTVEPTVTKTCAKCDKPGERFCYGEVVVGKYKYDHFCLECYPHHF